MGILISHFHPDAAAALGAYLGTDQQVKVALEPEETIRHCASGAYALLVIDPYRWSDEQLNQLRAAVSQHDLRLILWTSPSESNARPAQLTGEMHFRAPEQTDRMVSWIAAYQKQRRERAKTVS